LRFKNILRKKKRTKTKNLTAIKACLTDCNLIRYLYTTNMRANFPHVTSRATWLAFVIALNIVYQIQCGVLPAYIWPLAYIYNQTIPITPPMFVYGDVEQVAESGLQFDGKTGWIDAGDFQGMWKRSDTSSALHYLLNSESHLRF